MALVAKHHQPDLLGLLNISRRAPPLSPKKDELDEYKIRCHLTAKEAPHFLRATLS